MNRDEINCFETKTDQSKGRHVAQREPCIQSIKRGKFLIWGKRSPISDFSNVEIEREKERKVSFGDSRDLICQNLSG